MCRVNRLVAWLVAGSTVLTAASGCNGDSSQPTQPTLAADLVVVPPLSVQLAGTGVPGGSLSLGPWTLRNQGTVAAGRPFLNGYYLSTDATITTADRRLFGAADTDLGDLAAGASFTFPGDSQIAIPADVTPGIHFFGVLLDITGLVSESNEANNAASVSISVVADSG